MVGKSWKIPGKSLKILCGLRENHRKSFENPQNGWFMVVYFTENPIPIVGLSQGKCQSNMDDWDYTPISGNLQINHGP